MEHEQVDVLVLGAGPAGTPAALAAARTGARVAVVDAAERPGGQYHRQPARQLGARRRGAFHHGWASASDGYDRIERAEGVVPWLNTRAWRVEATSSGWRALTMGAHHGTIDARAIVLATGATERVLPFPGWDLAGVLTVGGAQALVKGQGVRPGRRVLLAGAGALLLASSSTLLAAGTDVAAVIDANGPGRWRRAGIGIVAPGKATEAVGYVRDLLRARVPYRCSRAVVRIEGDGRVERAVTMAVDAAWRPVPGTEEVHDVDAVCVSHGFTPNVGIAAALGCELTSGGGPAVVVDTAQRTSLAGVYAAGEVTGIAGAAAAGAEGRVAGAVAAASTGHAPDRATVRRDVRRRDREQRFGRALERATAIRDGWVDMLEDDTIICRCEEVPYAALRAAVRDAGARDVRSVKMTTRCGMGLCQARMCGANVADLVETATGAPAHDAHGLAARAIEEPVPLGAL